MHYWGVWHGAEPFEAYERNPTRFMSEYGFQSFPELKTIQTFAPEHYSLQFARAQDYVGFYEEERKLRRALLYPPSVSLVNIVIEGDSMADASRDARRAADVLKRELADGVRVLGPAFAVKSKVAGRYRTQILIKLRRDRHALVRRRIRTLLEDEALARVTSVDIDPLTLS